MKQNFPKLREQTPVVESSIPNLHEIYNQAKIKCNPVIQIRCVYGPCKSQFKSVQIGPFGVQSIDFLPVEFKNSYIEKTVNFGTFISLERNQSNGSGPAILIEKKSYNNIELTGDPQISDKQF